jgi:hypothetical protein
VFAGVLVIKINVKAKFNLQQVVKLYSFFNLGDRWGGWTTPRLGSFTPREDTRYPTTQGGGVGPSAGL